MRPSRSVRTVKTVKPLIHTNRVNKDDTTKKNRVVSHFSTCVLASHCDTTRVMTIPELDAKIAKLKNKIAVMQRDLHAAVAFREAYPRIMTEEKEEASTTPLDVQTAPLLPQTNGNVSTAEYVRRAITKCGKTYTINDVEKALSDAAVRIERTEISKTLSRFAADEEIIISQRGIGRRPTIFTKEESTS